MLEMFMMKLNEYKEVVLKEKEEKRKSKISMNQSERKSGVVGYDKMSEKVHLTDVKQTH